MAHEQPANLGDLVQSVLGPILDGTASDAADDVIPTGFDNLDEPLGGGLRTGQLSVIAGVPGAGASVLALDVARQAALSQGIRTAVITTDSSVRETTTRVIAATSGVPVHGIRRGRLTEAERGKLSESREQLASAPFWFESTLGAEDPLRETVGLVRSMMETLDIRLVVVDGTSQVEPHLRDLVRGLRVLAHKNDAAVMLVSAALMSRQARTRLPRMEDLRDYEAVADLFDLIMLVHREEIFDPACVGGEADVVVAKHRYGARCIVPFGFQGHLSRFVSWPASSRPIFESKESCGN